MDEPLSVFISAAALGVATLLPVINPAGMAPIFLSLTAGGTDRERTMAAARVGRGAFLLLTAAMVGGSSILVVFGLTLADIRIAGGLLVTATAWELMRTDHRAGASAAASPIESTDGLVRAGFYPLTFPVTIGPGSLAIAVTLGAAPPPALAGAVAAATAVSIAVYLCYRFAARVGSALGDARMLVLLRLSGFILLSVGVKIVCDGLVERFATGSA
jgi:multiple antibiotic resistance protein